MTFRVLVLLACLPAAARAGLRDIPNLPHPATIPTRPTQEREAGIPLELPVPELDRRAPPPDAAPAPERQPDKVYEIDMGAGADAGAPSRPAAAEIERAVAARDPGRLLELFDGDRRAAVGALAGLASTVALEPARVENLLRAAEPLSVERIRDAYGRTPPEGRPQQLFNTSVHDALAVRPLPAPVAAGVVASLERLASRALNDPASLANKLKARFHARRAAAARR